MELQRRHHLLVPQAALFQVAHQGRVDDGEVAGHVRFDVEVAVERLDRRVDSDDVGDGGGGRDRHHVGVAHPRGAHLLPQRVPVQPLGAVHIQVAAARLSEQLQRVDRQDASAPQRPFKRGVAAAFRRQVRGRFDGVVAEQLHALIRELHGLGGGDGQPQREQRVLVAHQPQADRAVPHVGAFRLGDGVQVHVDDVVEHAHRGAHGAAQPFRVQPVGADVVGQVHRAQVADSDLVEAGVEGDLGAQVGRVDDPGVLLRGPQVARVFEGDPRVPGLEQHGEHAPPQVHGAHPAKHADLPSVRGTLIGDVGAGEVLAVAVVQVRHFVGGEQGPLGVALHPFEEQVGHPVGGVHVVGAAALVTGVLPQVEEFLDVDVPGLQVGADRSFAFAALVHRHRCVVGDLEERDDALAFAVGAFDVGA